MILLLLLFLFHFHLFSIIKVLNFAFDRFNCLINLFFVVLFFCIVAVISVGVHVDLMKKKTICASIK